MSSYEHIRILSIVKSYVFYACTNIVSVISQAMRKAITRKCLKKFVMPH